MTLLISFLVTVVLALLIVGILLWAIQNFPWIDADIKHAIKIIVVVVVALWIIATLFGYISPVPTGNIFKAR